MCCDFTEEYIDQKNVWYRLGVALSFTLKGNTKFSLQFLCHNHLYT